MPDTAGDTLTELPLMLPGCQLYELAPLADKVALPPSQMLALLLVLMLGGDTTVTDAILLLAQLFVPVPVTV